VFLKPLKYGRRLYLKTSMLPYLAQNKAAVEAEKKKAPVEVK